MKIKRNVEIPWRGITRKMKSTGPTKKPRVNPCVLQWLALPASYKAPFVFRFGRNLFGDRGKKTLYVKGKRFIAI
jgi:hypothetical protein